MKTDTDKIYDAYEKLTAESAGSWDAYAGELSQELAQAKGIPAEKWNNDRVTMQASQEIMKEELAHGCPETLDDLDGRVRGMIDRLLDSSLRAESNDAARKGFLLQMIQVGSDADAQRLAELSRKDIHALREEVIELTVSLAKEKVFPVLESQCRQAAEQEPLAVENAGALAVAEYLEVPEVQNMPEAVGAGAAIVDACQEEDITENKYAMVAIGLALAAAVIAYWALVALGVAAVSAMISTVLVEGVTVGVGAAIAAEIAFLAEPVAVMLKISLGGFILASAFGILAKLSEKIAPPAPMYHTSTQPQTTTVST